jgi:hypothetical protein
LLACLPAERKERGNTGERPTEHRSERERKRWRKEEMEERVAPKEE